VAIGLMPAAWARWAFVAALGVAAAATVIADLDQTIRAMDQRLRSERLLELERLRLLPEAARLAQAWDGAASVGDTASACDEVPCWCPRPIVDAGCHAFPQGALGRGASGGDGVAGAASKLAAQVIALRSTPVPDRPRQLVAAIGAGSMTDGFVVTALPEPAAQSELRTAIAGRLPLYAVALLSPLLLLGSLLAAARRVALAEAEAARARAEAERDAAESRQRLAVAASEAASLGLRELGHEVLSPAATLLLALEARRADAIASEGGWLDTAEGCVRRIARAGERARSALRLQQRHADALREGRPVDIGAFLRERVRVEQLAGEWPCRVELPDPPVCVIADLGNLEEVVGNLLSNARRFRGDGPVVVAVSASRDRVRITFHNRGPQIGPADLARIFEPWVSLAPDSDGSNEGLGLWFVREAVTAMGGTVEVENDPPPATRGLRFVVDLPRAG
jgi:signal transduction histidine kinase